jgi:hypothetical protein
MDSEGDENQASSSKRRHYEEVDKGNRVFSKRRKCGELGLNQNILHGSSGAKLVDKTRDPSRGNINKRRFNEEKNEESDQIGAHKRTRHIEHYGKEELGVQVRSQDMIPATESQQDHRFDVNAIAMSSAANMNNPYSEFNAILRSLHFERQIRRNLTLMNMDSSSSSSLPIQMPKQSNSSSSLSLEPATPQSSTQTQNASTVELLESRRYSRYALEYRRRRQEEEK